MFHSIWRPVARLVSLAQIGELARRLGGDGVGTPYDGLYGEAPPERGTYLFQASGI